MTAATPDLDAFADLLRTRRLCEPGVPIAVARAPGRLDVMGGIADYSGSLVIERPIAEATWAAIQPTGRPVLDVVSVGRPPLSFPLETLAPDGEPIGYDQARRLFRDSNPWAAYVAGVLLVLARERAVPLRSGLRIVVWSTVPEGKGVSSSAALETATMHAAAQSLGLQVTGRDLAILCQRAENLVAGAPCGVMDQMTCVFGEPETLLALLCQPAELQPFVQIPSVLEFWGLDSGERHTVGGLPRASPDGESRGSDYGAVRTGAFMGLRLLRAEAGLSTEYLANVGPLEFESELLRHLPDEMTGDGFLARYGDIDDSVTTVQPGRRYRVCAPTAHPIYERQRAEEFRRLLTNASDEAACVRLGELMYGSHASYGRCGLGATGTDRLVELVRREGAASGLYGARITGGGSGGTVAVLGRSDAGAAIARVADAYRRDTGHHPHVFEGSSPGVLAFGGRTIEL
jgi:L-arabinokinase